MLCKWCNKEVDNNARFCPSCGGNLVNEGNQVNESIVNNSIQTTEVEPIVTPVQEPVVSVEPTTVPIQESVVASQPYVNVANTVQPQKIQEGKANVGLVILSCLIPLAGLIIFLVKKDTDKKTAKASGIAALISCGVSILIAIIVFVIMTFSIRNSFKNGVDDFINDIDTVIPDVSYDEEINEEDNDNNLENITTSTDWKNYEFSVNNTTLKLPSTYNELSSATSSVIQSSYINSYLQAGYYAPINMYKNDNLSLYVEILNDTESDLLYTDCKITRITQTKYQVSVGAAEIIFPGGLKVGQEITKEEIIDLLGTPFDIDNYTSDGYVKDTYSYVEDATYTTTNNYKISVVNGVIDELSLDNRNYN